jgi:GTP1/Obg family GTP-binding protein
MNLDYERRLRLEKKLERCKELAREYREGRIAEMIRDMQEEIVEQLRRLN